MGRPPETDNLLRSWPPSDSQPLPVVLESSAHLHGAPPPPRHTHGQVVGHRLCTYLASRYILPAVLPPLRGAETVVSSERLLGRVTESGCFGVCTGLSMLAGGFGPGVCGAVRSELVS